MSSSRHSRDKHRKEEKDRRSIRHVSSSQLNYGFIKDRRKNNLMATASQIATALVNEIKIKGNYRKGEKLFKILKEELQDSAASQPNYEYHISEVLAFERSIATLVRYAIDTATAKHYFLIAFQKYQASLRTPILELYLLTNLIVVYAAHFHDKKNMLDTLELVQMALDIGVYRVEIPKEPCRVITSEKFTDLIQVFDNVAKCILDYHNLEFTADKNGFQPIKTDGRNR